MTTPPRRTRFAPTAAAPDPSEQLEAADALEAAVGRLLANNAGMAERVDDWHALAEARREYRRVRGGQQGCK